MSFDEKVTEALECLRLLQLRGENQGVEPALVDEDHPLVSSMGIAIHAPLVFLVVRSSALNRGSGFILFT